MAEASEGGRIRSIDVFKGVAIVGVVMSHVVALQQIRGEGQVSFNAAEFVYMVLPMFIIISGYFYNPEKGLGHYLKKRILPLILLVIAANIVLTTVMFGYLSLLGYDLDISTLLPNISSMVIGRNAFQPIIDPWFEMIYGVYDVTHSLYFIEMLAVGSIIFYLIAEWALKNWKRTFGTILLLLTMTCAYVETVKIQLPFHAHLAPLTASLLLIGAFFGKHKVAEYIRDGPRDRKYWAIFLGLLAGSIAMITAFPSRMSLIYSIFGWYGGYSVYTFFILAILCGGVLMYILTFISKLKTVGNCFSYLGKHSLSIFVLHMFFAKLLTAPFYTLDLEVWIPITSIPIAIGVAILSIILSMAVPQLITYCMRTKGRSKGDPSLNR